MAGLTIPAISLAAPTSADPAGNGPWQTSQEGPFSEIQEDFCDVPGLTVEFEFANVLQVRLSRILGPDQFPYDFYFHEGYETYTNVDTGESVTLLKAGDSQDIRLSDNGDGTFTRYVTNKGQGVLYSDTGEVLARNAGVFSYSVVYSYAGTPSDPSDDSRSGGPPSSRRRATVTTSARSSAPSVNRNHERAAESPHWSIRCASGRASTNRVPSQLGVEGAKVVGTRTTRDVGGSLR